MRHPVRLLLVEDNEDHKALIHHAFQRKDPAVEVTAVENGPAALEMLGRDHYDIIILDYSLPRLNGLEVLSRIQDQGNTTPVIMVTGQGDEKIAVEAMKRGAYDYILKTKNYHQTLPIVVQKTIEKYQLKSLLEDTSSRNRRLYEASLAVAKQRRVKTLAETLVSGARQLIKTQGAIFFLIDPEQSKINFVTSSGIRFQEDLQGPVRSTGVLGLAYAERKSLGIEDPHKHPHWEVTPAHQPQIQQLLTIPLFLEDKVQGILTVLNKENGMPFSQGDIDSLSTLSVHAMMAIDNARFLEEMEMRAVTDSLTDFYNHRECQRRITEELERSNRYGHDLSLLMVDIDHFKNINDTHGHVVGDSVLREVVKIIRECIRNIDIPCRYGGKSL